MTRECVWLEIAMFTESGEEVCGWHGERVTLETSNDIETLSGVNFLQFTYSATNPGLPSQTRGPHNAYKGPPQGHFGLRKSHVVKGISAGST